jgi:hypothetical protein
MKRSTKQIQIQLRKQRNKRIVTAVASVVFCWQRPPLFCVTKGFD